MAVERVGNLQVVLTTRDSGFKRDMKAARTAVQRFDRGTRKTHRSVSRMDTGMARASRSAKSLAASLGAVFAVRQVAGAAKELITLGTAVEETGSKFRTVFGAASQDVQRFIDDQAAIAGLSKSRAQEVLATTGAIVQGFGLAQRESAAFSTDVVKLAADLSSFNNVPIEDTAKAIQSALAGEREQIKRYGIVLREAHVVKRAFEMTGKSTTAQLTEEDRALATLNLLYEKAGVAVGDLARTQDSSANILRRVAAEWQNVKESVGTALVEFARAAQADRHLANLAANLKVLATAIGRDAGLAFYAAGQYIGAKLGEGIAGALAEFGHALAIQERIPVLGDLFEKLNLVARGWEAVGAAARRSAEDAREALKVLGDVSDVADKLRPEIAALTAPQTGPPIPKPPPFTGLGSNFQRPGEIAVAPPDVAVRDFSDIPAFRRPAASVGFLGEARIDIDQLRQNIAKPVVDFGKELKAIGFDMGEDLVTGLMQGTLEMGDILKRFLASFASRFILGPFASFLGIASPSKKFAEYGRLSGLGYIEGVRSMSGAVASAVGGMASSTTPSPVGSVTPGGALTAKIDTSDTSQFPPWALEWLSDANVRLKFAGAR